MFVNWLSSHVLYATVLVVLTVVRYKSVSRPTQFFSFQIGLFSTVVILSGEICGISFKEQLIRIVSHFFSIIGPGA